MTRDELSKMLDGREYRNEISSDIQDELNNSDMVVVFGYSDDNMEFRGAISGEISCYGGGTDFLKIYVMMTTAPTSKKKLARLQL